MVLPPAPPRHPSSRPVTPTPPRTVPPPPPSAPSIPPPSSASRPEAVEDALQATVHSESHQTHHGQVEIEGTPATAVQPESGQRGDAGVGASTPNRESSVPTDYDGFLRPPMTALPFLSNPSNSPPPLHGKSFTSSVKLASSIRHRSPSSSSTSVPVSETILPPLPPANPETEEERDARLQATLEELEDAELSKFVARVGKRVLQVRLPGGRVDAPIITPMPRREDFRTAAGRVDYVAFLPLLAQAMLDRYTPLTLVVPPLKDRLSLGTGKEHLERLLILAPAKVLLEEVFTPENEIARVWRWQSEDSWKWCALYTFLVLFDLVPFFLPFLALFFLARARLFPPSTEEQLAHLMERSSRSSEATELSEELGTPSRFGFAKELFRDRFGKGEDAGMEKGIYGIGLELGRVLGPSVQDLLDQAVDLLEKAKNIYMHPTHPSVPPIILRLAVISLILLCTPTWIQIKFFWTCLGVEFFVLWRLRELEGGKRRRVLNPIWWLLLGAPTDAEYAQYILQKRGLAGNPLKGSKTIKRISKSRASLEGSVSAMDAAPELGSRTGSFSSITSRHSITPSISSMTSFGVDDASTISKYFALYKSTPGHLSLTSTHLVFTPTRGFRTLGKVLSSSSSPQPSPPILSPTNSSSSGVQKSFLSNLKSGLGEVKSVFNELNMGATNEERELVIPVREITELKKETKLSVTALDGMCVEVLSGKTHVFRSVNSRDELFNKIVSFASASSSSFP